jgi:hypothetical protein
MLALSVPQHFVRQPALIRATNTILRSSAGGGRRIVAAFAVTKNVEHDLDNDNNRIDDDTQACSDPFIVAMEQLGFSETTKTMILQKLHMVGIENAPADLSLLAHDFLDRPEVLSTLLQSDFGLDPMLAHQTRAAAIHMIRPKPQEVVGVVNKDEIPALAKKNINTRYINPSNETSNLKKSLFKSLIVNEQAILRRRGQTNGKHNHQDDGETTTNNNEYGLPRDYAIRYPQLARDLNNFLSFMTRPTTYSQEEPLRLATASVYLRHAKLFLGWYLTYHRNVPNHNDNHANGTVFDPSSNQSNNLVQSVDDANVSIFSIIPNRNKDSAECILSFLVWLRSTRHISVSYEANLLRGLSKLLKFRFAKESQSDPSYGEKSFEDIPMIRELRKLHRDANKRQRVAPRSSNEAKKWLSWPEYLQVVQDMKKDLEQMIMEYQAKKTTKADKRKTQSSSSKDDNEEISSYSPAQRKIATFFQRYLILAIFASVPDRQRTIRELELKRTFVKDETTGIWVIQHRPDDYKTGKAYGVRPPLALAAPGLGEAVDEFLSSWRECLQPTSEFVFCQPRTGNPLTQDSVYQIVARSCFQYTGKRTNPHLLRDMIVTHIRESSDASEQQLEALALFMGHSIQMQRTSYDRRTLTKKIAPAVDLLRSVNQVIPTKET